MSGRWHAPGGYREALAIGLPLVVSLASTTVMQFTDRIFLGHYSLEALAACMPAGMASFLFLSFFMGVGEYVNVFVAQYTGAARPERVGVALWQGIWFCVPAWFILAALGFTGGFLFSLAGHPPAVAALEDQYFRIMSFGSGIMLLGITIACFYSGRGITKPVMVVNMIGAAVNIPLDYALINGVWWFPELGIRGAAIATVAAQALNAIMFSLLVFRRENQRCFHVLDGWRLDMDLMKRFLRFGLPGGVQFFVDMFSVVFFVFSVGSLGVVQLTSTNIVFSLYTLSFLPMIGMSVAASVMVGQAMGAQDPVRGDYATGSVLRLAMLYMGFCGLMFVIFPNFLINLFQPENMSPAEFAPVVAMSTNLLRIAAGFVLVDACVIIYMGALKGAGDTRFIMITMILSAIFIMVGPIFIMQYLFTPTVYGPWSALFCYVIVLASAFRIRFKKGAWRTMRVIEHE